MFIISLFFSPNYTYLFVTFCVISGLVDKDLNDNYNFMNFSTFKKSKSVLKIKNLFVLETEQLYKIVKYINSNSFINLHIYDKDNLLVEILDEKEFVDLLQKSFATDTFKTALNNHKGTF